MAERKQMHIGLFVFPHGHLLGSWRHPDAPRRAAFDFQHFRRVAQAAEAARLDMVFLSDTVAERENQSITPQATSFEPTTLLAALATVTQKIGLVATMSSSFNEPYNVARRFASLDLISKGRIGWNLVTTSYQPEALNFNRDAHYAHADRYRRAHEFAEVVSGLWQSWDDEAFLFDQQAGRFFDPGKVRRLDHVGEHFSVRGPLNVGPSPQGRPVIVQAGSSEAGKELAAATAELVFTVQSDIDEARAFYRDLKGRMARYGRHPDELKILPGVSPFLGATSAEARARYDSLLELIPVPQALAMLSDQLGGFDLSPFDPAQPLPPIPPSNAGQTRRENILRMARDGNLSLQETAVRHAVTAGHLQVVGTPSQTADTLQQWFETEACDGFNFKPPVLPVDADAFYQGVIPELQRRGLFRREYEGSTLRSHLGLAVPRTSINASQEFAR